MNKIFKIFTGIVAAATTLGIFGGLSWWVSTEGSAVGYVAAVLFGLMAVLGAIIIYIMIVLEYKTSKVRTNAGKSKRNGELDPGMAAAVMLVGTSGQFNDDESADISEDYTDDVTDFD